MKKQPSALDKRVAQGFQELANQSHFFQVSCRFRRVIRPKGENIVHVFWPKGAEEFKAHFGSAANYFAGALEYVRLATGWHCPSRGLEVMVFDGKGKITSGFAIHSAFRNPKYGEIRINWANGEFTITVLHELVHLFKKGWDEERVEQEALRLTVSA